MATGGAYPASTTMVLDKSLVTGAEMMDALPYIDHEWDNEGLKMEVHRLVEEEMARFQPRDYLSSRPLPTTSHLMESPLVRAEMDRLAGGKPLEAINTARYNLNPPTVDLQGDLQAWRNSLRNAKAQGEHLGVRLVNTELMSTYGAEAWLVYNQELEAMKTRLDKELKEVKKEAETVNLVRKTEQEKVAPRIYNLTMRRDETIAKNLEIQIAIAALQRDVKRMRADLEGRGVSMAAIQDHLGGGRGHDEDEDDE